MHIPKHVNPVDGYAHPSTARNDAEANVSAMKEDYREAVSKGIKPSQSLIIGLSKKHRVQYGKWLLWIHKDCVTGVSTNYEERSIHLERIATELPYRWSPIIKHYSQSFLFTPGIVANE